MNFNAYEILEMAEQIERNGATFYRTAAEVVEDTAGKKLLQDLANWEIGHEKIFSTMKKEFKDNEAGDSTFDPNGEASLYIKAFSDGHVFNLDEDPKEFLKNKKTLKDILIEAISREKDAIVFFSGFLEFVPASLGKSRVEAIIKEEISHIGQLSDLLTSLKE